MIHYHGTPITPRSRLLELAGRHFCVSYARPDDLRPCIEIGQSLMLDNGAFSLWRAGGQLDVDGFARWVRPLLYRRENWCVIPDVIDGGEGANDDLVASWLKVTRLEVEQCAPVWHMDESLARLWRLINRWPRVCIGSAGAYAEVGDSRWHRRMREAMDEVCGAGPPPCWLHMLRGLSFAGGEYPFASADSTLIAQNHGGNMSRGRRPKDIERLADDVDSRQQPPYWRPHADQLGLTD